MREDVGEAAGEHRHHPSGDVLHTPDLLGHKHNIAIRELLPLHTSSQRLGQLLITAEVSRQSRGKQLGICGMIKDRDKGTPPPVISEQGQQLNGDL